MTASVRSPPRLGTKQRGCEGGLRGQTAGLTFCFHEPHLPPSITAQLVSAKLTAGWPSTSREEPLTSALSESPELCVNSSGSCSQVWWQKLNRLPFPRCLVGHFLPFSFPLCFSPPLSHSRLSGWPGREGWRVRGLLSPFPASDVCDLSLS